MTENRQGFEKKDIYRKVLLKIRKHNLKVACSSFSLSFYLIEKIAETTQSFEQKDTYLKVLLEIQKHNLMIAMFFYHFEFLLNRYNG